MNNIQYQKIGLCIAGTKSRQGGFTPFVITGILAGNEDSNMDRVTLVVEKPVYVIKHTNEYILYQLIDRKVKPCDRDTLGVLSIALTITRDMQFADGKSPYALLKEVYDKFRNDYMESDGNECDRFINKDVDSADFVSIMEKYPLENRSNNDYISMNPSGLSGKLRVPQEKMEDLFRDTQYREFAQFKEIEIGVNCQTTPGLENIEIPRPIVYAIVINDKRIEETMSRPDDFFDTASVLHDTSDIRYDNLSFCLEDLLNSPEHRIQSGKSSVTLDVDGRFIRCKIYKEEIKYSLEYRFEGGTEKDRQHVANDIVSKKIRLLIGENLVSFYSSSPQKTVIPASWARKNAVITPNYEGVLRFNVAKLDVDDENRMVTVTIQIATEVKNIATGTSNRHSNLNYPASCSEKEKVKDDYKEEKENKPQNHDDNYPPKKTKHGKRWILLTICCFVGVCIGAGIVGATWWMVGEKKLTRDDSLRIAKLMARKISIDSIIPINMDSIGNIKSLRPLYNLVNAEINRNQDLREEYQAQEAEKKAKAEAEKKAKAEAEKKAKAEAEKKAKAEAEKKAIAERKLNDARNDILLEINKTHDIT
ncbi:hypothetical protein I6E10_14015, partial [Phocaeicola barnesiae]|uniref:hypothetical protein n=1 Tax=Phocaeicola barnesiae TaxID=376804 RepID=UPI001F449E25